MIHILYKAQKLFAGLQIRFVGHFQTIELSELKQLVIQCGAEVVDSHESVINVVDVIGNNNDQMHKTVKYDWILDSLCCWSLLSIERYTVRDSINSYY